VAADAVGVVGAWLLWRGFKWSRKGMDPGSSPG